MLQLDEPELENKPRVLRPRLVKARRDSRDQVAESMFCCVLRKFKTLVYIAARFLSVTTDVRKT